MNKYWIKSKNNHETHVGSHLIVGICFSRTFIYIYFKNMHLLCVCVWVCLPCVHSICGGQKRTPGSPWNGSYRYLQATTWVLKIKARSSGRTPCAQWSDLSSPSLLHVFDSVHLERNQNSDHLSVELCSLGVPGCTAVNELSVVWSTQWSADTGPGLVPDIVVSWQEGDNR